ncbi:MAG: GNAT family N-acetyltransferase [Succinivibrio sp.]|nr:GNAT family N-acetyltransferase [Succinivibrio sp.]
MSLKLLPLEQHELAFFKQQLQEAFQLGAAELEGSSSELVLPEEDIEASLKKDGAAAFKAELQGRIIGGAIVVVEGDIAALDFLYVAPDAQGHGFGQQIFAELELLYPKVRLWQTMTPYFEKRNLHFYINCLNFQAVEFFNPHHPDPTLKGRECSEEEQYFFRFEKKV